MDTTPEDYTYAEDDVKSTNEKDLNLYGVQLDSTNVGLAETSEVFINFEVSKTLDYRARNLQQGNVVRVGFTNKTVKTPYRIAYLDIHQPTKDSHREPNWENREFELVLEPFNNRTDPLVLAGQQKLNPKTQKKFVEWTTSENYEGEKTINQLIECIDKSEYDTQRAMRHMGDKRVTVHDIYVLSDLSIVELLEIKEPRMVKRVI